VGHVPLKASAQCTGPVYGFSSLANSVTIYKYFLQTGIGTAGSVLVEDHRARRILFAGSTEMFFLEPRVDGAGSVR